jgi:uncharacterized OB-fold protein
MVAIVSKPYWSGLKKEAEIIKTYKTKNNLFKFMRDKDIPVVAIVTFKDGEQVTTLVNTDRKNTLKIGGKMARLGY